jgi:hypothetical protein
VGFLTLVDVKNCATRMARVLHAVQGKRVRSMFQMILYQNPKCPECGGRQVVACRACEEDYDVKRRDGVICTECRGTRQVHCGYCEFGHISI